MTYFYIYIHVYNIYITTTEVTGYLFVENFALKSFRKAVEDFFVV